MGMLIVGNGFPFSCSGKNRGCDSLRAWGRVTVVQPMVGKAATKGVEIVVALLKGVQEGVQVGYVNVRDGRKSFAPAPESLITDGESFVWSEGWKDPCRQIRFRDRLGVAEVICGIVGCSHHLNVKFLKNRVGA